VTHHPIPALQRRAADLHRDWLTLLEKHEEGLCIPDQCYFDQKRCRQRLDALQARLAIGR
jgi:hypothetical protein